MENTLYLNKKRGFRSWVKVMLVAVLSLTAMTSNATLVVDPAGDGGFESGSTFTANGWSFDNGTATNKWYLAPFAITGMTNNVAYVSSDLGVTNGYSNGSISVVHFWRDITVPAGETDVTLSFNWQALGESGSWDAVMVSVAPTTYTPVASTTSLGTGNLAAPATTLGQFWTQSTTQTATLKIPASLIGNCSSAATIRLIFTWKNDGSGGSNPAGSVDNVSVVSAAPAIPASGGTFTIDNTLPTSGSNFNSFIDAVNAVNVASGCGLTGPVTFNVTAGQSFAGNVPALTASGTLANPITFQRSGAGANPVIVPTGTTGTVDFGFCISGGDYITIDGIDINASAVSAVEYGYLVRSLNATDGAKNNTIKNFTVTMNRSLTASRGILQSASTTGGGVAPTAQTGANDGNKYYNFNIYNVYAGIYLLGNSSFPDQNCEIGTTSCSTFNYVGNPAQANDIGNNTSQTWGIQCLSQFGVKVYNNIISNVTHTSTSTMWGIYLNNTGSTTTSVGTSEVYRNYIRTLRSTSTSTTSHQMWGIRAEVTNNAASITRIYNNVISDLNNASTNTASRQIMGIYIQGSGTGTAGSHNVDFNTVYMNPTSLGCSNACYEIGTTSGSVIRTRNNNFVNATPVQTGTPKHYCWVTTSATSIGNTGSVSNYNNLYVVNGVGGNGFVGLASTDRVTLINWQAVAAGVDANSVSADPVFLNAATGDYHCTAAALDNAGSFLSGAITWVTNDFDCQSRPIGANPDIGADEYTAYTVDMSVTALANPTAASCHSASENVNVTIRNLGTATIDFSTNNATITVVIGGAGSGTISTTLTSGTLAPGASQTVTVGTTNTTAAGTYTFASSVAVTGDGNSANDSRSDNVTITGYSVAITGTPSVCIGSSRTLTAVPTGNNGSVTYNWTDGVSSVGTTAAISVSPTVNTTYTVTATDACPQTTTQTVTVVVNPLPTPSVTPAASATCGPVATQLIASGGTTYAWSPATGLNTTTNDTVVATASVSTIYTVTVTDANSCAATTTAAITVNGAVSITASATNLSVCNNGSTVLNAAASVPYNYFISNISHAPTTPSGGTTVLTNGGTNLGTLSGSLDDGTWANIPLPFNFDFFGTSHDTVAIGTNGYLWFGAGAANTNGGYGTALPNATSARPAVAAMYADLNFASRGVIEYFTEGVSPSRKFIVNWTNGAFWASSTDTATMQLVLNEGSNTIEVHTTLAKYAAGFKTQGVQNAAGTAAFTVSGRNAAGWSVTTTPDAYLFTPDPGAFNYTWTPSTFLNDSTLQGPTASNMTATTAYTVTATNVGTGCTGSATVNITVAAPIVSTLSAAPATICQGQSSTITSTTSGGGAPYTYLWSPGGQTTANITVSPTSSTWYWVRIYDACGDSLDTDSVLVTVNPTPTITMNTSSAVYCTSPVQLIASSIGTTYAWSPVTGLNTSTNDTVLASPSATTTYTVTATLSGCTASATVTVTKGIPVASISATATPASICNGDSSQLAAVAYGPPLGTYSVSAVTHSLESTAGFTAGPLSDDSQVSTALPFSFNFFGTAVTSVSIVSNGFIVFNTTSTDLSSDNIPNTATPNGIVALAWTDLNPSAGGTITYGTVGVAPNRIWVASYVGVAPFSTNGTGSISGQIKLFENGGFIEIHTASSTLTAAQMVQGIENFAGTVGNPSPGRNGGNWTVGTADAYRFSPDLAVITSYSWAPSTFLNNPAISNPQAQGVTVTTTYTVTATEASGCTASTTVTVTAGDPLAVTATATPGSLCAGQSTTIAAVVTGGGAPYTYDWTDGITTFSTNASETVTPGTSTAYTVTVSDNCGTTASATVPVTVNTPPTISVTNSQPTLCTTGASSTLIASGADTYTWAPSTGLNTTTNDTVIATPLATTTYVVTGTATGTGCTATASTTVGVGLQFVSATAIATPASICNADTTVLSASATFPPCATYYTVSSTTYGLQPTTGFTTTAGGDDADLATGVTLPFSFNFFGTAQTAINISSNGYVYFGAANGGTIGTQAYPSATTPNNLIGMFHGDLLPAAGQITYGTVGVSPNQIFVIDYNGVPAWNVGGTNSGQIQIFEDGHIEVHVTVSTSTNVKSLGVENSAATDGISPAGRSNSSWTVGTPEAWSFNYCISGSVTNYAWTPSSTLDDSTLATPTSIGLTGSTVFTVTLTNNSGCTTTATASVTVGDPLVVTPDAAPDTICSGTSTTLSANASGGGAPYTYDWSDGVTTIGSTATLVLTPASTTTYTVSVSDNCGNTSTGTVTVVVNTTPTVTVSASPASFCSVGGTTTLTASGASTYSWGSAGSIQDSVTVNFTVSAQPAETNVAPGNLVASATLPALPGGAVVSSATFTYNGLVTTGASFNIDVNMGLNGAVTMTEFPGDGAGLGSGTFNYIRNLSSPSVNTAGGTVNLTYWDDFDDNFGDETTFPLGANVASLVIRYSYPGSGGNPLTVSVATTTTYTVTGTAANGCTATGTTTVVVVPTTTITTSATPADVCAGGSSQLNAVASYPTPSAPTGYCAASSSFNGTCINRVTVNTMDAAGMVCAAHYEDVPEGTATTTLMPGSTYPLTIYTSATTYQASVWVDFNRDGSFNDASEQFVLLAYSGTPTSGPFTVNIPVPSGASVGKTKMRVRIREGTFTSNCDVFGSGSSKDFTVTIGIPIAGTFTYSWSPAGNLDNSAIANPVASPVNTTTTYTVTSTDSYGCTATGTVTVNVSPLTVSASAFPTTICAGTSSTLSSTVSGGGTPYVYNWTDGVSSVGTTASLSVTPSATTTYTLTVTDSCGASQFVLVPVTVIASPTVSVTNSNPLLCGSGSSQLVATSPTGLIFAWSPATGLNNTTNDTVAATPTTTTTYTVVVTDGTGCTGSATTTVTFAPAIAVDVTADTTQSCAPMGTILRACVNPVLNTYNVTSATYGLQSTAGFSNGPTGDDTFGGPYAIPFSFNYFGNLYNDLYIGTNGYITFGSGSGDRFVQTFPSATAPNNIVAIGYCDLNVTTAGMVTYGTVGVAPNRIFVIDFNGVPPFSGTGTLSGQIQLFENGNKVEIHVTSASLTNAKTLGIENSTGTSGASPTGRNNAAWTVTTPEAWSFVAAARQCNNTGITFSWSPATALTATNLDTAEVSGLNTTTQYTVTAMNASGCAATDTVTLIIYPQAATPTITPSGPLSFCPGGSVTLTSSNTSFPNSWSTGETTVSITVSTTQAITLIASDAFCPSAPASVNVLRYDTIQPLINVSGGGLAICGGTRDLLADGAPQFTAWNWSTTETTQQITIGTPGTYGVSATDLNGCLTYNSVTFVAGQTPVAPVISTASNDTVCNNDLVTITSDLSDGLTWFPTFDNTASISYNLSPPGSYEFYVTRDSLGCTSESNHLTFVVNPSPEVTAFSPADSACVGDVITLSGSGFTNVSSISFNGTPATTFTVVDDFTITVTVPAGATSGGITLTDGSTGCAGVSPLFTIKVVCGSTLNMTAFIQGYYSGGSMAAPLFINGISPNATDCDTIKVCLMHPTTYAEVECATGILQTDGTVSLSFTSSGYFFIKVTHQNAVQTWSADSVNVTGTTSYDFTTDNLQSYGPNMVEVATGVWAFWSGDVNQDELVEATDYTTVENDAVGFVSGYFPSDLTGDAITEAADYSLIENNLPFFLASLHP